MKTLLTITALAFALTGCNTFNSLTAAQKAQIFCVVAADGTAAAIASTKGGANATANTIQGASVQACNAATAVGQIVTKP